MRVSKLSFRIAQSSTWDERPGNVDIFSWDFDFEFDEADFPQPYYYSIWSNNYNIAFGMDSDSVSVDGYDTSKSDVSGWRCLGNIETTHAIGQDLGCWIYLKTNNYWANQYANGYEWETSLYWYENTIDKVQVKTETEFWSQFIDEQTHTHIFGDGLGEFDIGDLTLSYGSSPL
ncbi:MAG: hypothetical protein ACTSRK_12135 [Promethearchaeota archaeon]